MQREKRPHPELRRRAHFIVINQLSCAIIAPSREEETSHISLLDLPFVSLVVPSPSSVKVMMSFYASEWRNFATQKTKSWQWKFEAWLGTPINRDRLIPKQTQANSIKTSFMSSSSIHHPTPGLERKQAAAVAVNNRSVLNFILLHMCWCGMGPLSGIGIKHEFWEK